MDIDMLAARPELAGFFPHPLSSFLLFLCCCYQSDDDKARLERAAAAAGTGSLKCGLDLMSERAARLILCVCTA